MFLIELLKNFKIKEIDLEYSHSKLLDQLSAKEEVINKKFKQDRLFKWFFEGNLDKIQQKSLIENEFMQKVFDLMRSNIKPIHGCYTVSSKRLMYTSTTIDSYPFEKVFMLSSETRQFDIRCLRNKPLLKCIRVLFDKTGNKALCLSKEVLDNKEGLRELLLKVSDGRIFSEPPKIIQENGINYLKMPGWFNELSNFNVEDFFVAALEQIISVKFALSLVKGKPIFFLEDKTFEDKILSVPNYEQSLSQNFKNNSEFFKFLDLNSFTYTKEMPLFYGNSGFKSFGSHNFVTENFKLSLKSIVEGIFFRRLENASGEDKVFYDKIEAKIEQFYASNLVSFIELDEPKKKTKRKKKAKALEKSTKPAIKVKKNNFFCNLSEDSIECVVDEKKNIFEIQRSKLSIPGETKAKSVWSGNNFTIESTKKENPLDFSRESQFSVWGEKIEKVDSVANPLEKAVNTIILETDIAQLETKKTKEIAVDFVKNTLKEFTGNKVSVEIVGSHVTKLAVKGSDVDLIVLNKAVSEQIREISQYFEGKEAVKSVAFFPKASIPLIKIDILVDKYTVKVDLALHKEHSTKMNSIRAKNTVREEIIKDKRLRPLVLLFKLLLDKHGLNNSYKGGLGSYSLTLMVMAFLKVANTDKSDYSALIIQFLDFYTSVFNFQYSMIDFRSNQVILTSPQKQETNHIIIYDKNSLTEVAKSSYEYSKVVSLFAETKRRLVEMMFEEYEKEDFYQVFTE